MRTTVDARTDMQTPQAFRQLVVRQDGEMRVLLGDVADVELSAENNEFNSFSSGREAIFIAITPTPEANSLEVARRVQAALPQIRSTLPADMELLLDWDASISIDAALKEVITTLIEAALIVILVIYLFLGSLRVVIIPLVVIPLSLIGVIFVLAVLGFTLNLLTLLAMIIAIGLVVHDATMAVAEGVGGTAERFVQLMNEQAKALGEGWAYGLV